MRPSAVSTKQSEIRLSIPSGVKTFLYQAFEEREDGGRRGVVRFFDDEIVIEVPDPGEVLFPTNAGLSLLEIVQQHRPMSALRGLHALDIGAGSGIYSLALLAAGCATATALDINPACGDVITANRLRNGLTHDRLRVALTDLAQFRPDHRFDLVVANPPHFPDNAVTDGLGTALDGGLDGRALYDMLIDRLDDLLTQDGELLLAHSSLADIPLTKRELASRGFSCTVVGVSEMDIALMDHGGRGETVMAHLKELHQQGRAAFVGNRFEVHVLSFTRNPRPL